VDVYDAVTTCDPAVPDGVSAIYAVDAVLIADQPDGVSSLDHVKNAPDISTTDPDAIDNASRELNSLKEIAAYPLRLFSIVTPVEISVDISSAR
jgi:hypothetical protein